MIWQLVKRDPAWRNALIFTAVSAVACPVLPVSYTHLTLPTNREV